MVYSKQARNVIVVLAFAIHGLAQLPKQTSLQVRQKTFDAVWKAVNDKSIAPQFNHIDWAAVKLRYEPQIAAVQSDAEFQDVVDRLRGEQAESRCGDPQRDRLQHQLSHSRRVRRYNFRSFRT